MNAPACTGRFAPTPSGPLHLGSLATAAASWLHARRRGGRWLVRVDDIDPDREVAGATGAILTGLARCGLAADAPPVHQARRGSLYGRALEQLRTAGHVFPCWCSRSELRAAQAAHRDGRCLHGPVPGRAPALRLRVPPGVTRFHDLVRGPVAQDVRAEVGDFTLRRADGCWSYHLACAVDEAALGVTEVVRGDDLLASTPRQLLLLQLLGLPAPRYAHLPLMRDACGGKLGKSTGAAPIDLRQPAAALRSALVHLGCVPPPGPAGTAELLAWALPRFRLPSA